MKEGSRVQVDTPFETDDMPDHVIQMVVGDTGIIISLDEGWFCIDFDKDSTEQHWVEPLNVDKLKMILVDPIISFENNVHQMQHQQSSNCVGQGVSIYGAKSIDDFQVQSTWIGHNEELDAVRKPAVQKLCLVLDIDGTLLAEPVPYNYTNLYPYLRPGLEEFLDFVFSSCGAVGLWTAASRQHLESFLEAMDPTKSRPWSFTWSGKLSYVRSSSSSLYEGMHPMRHQVKKLRKIWQNNRLCRQLGYTRHSTLIVDNTPEKCSCNYGNAIYVSTYVEGHDDVLKTLVAYLQELIHEHERFGQNASVLRREKRSWYLETSSRCGSLNV